MGAGGDRTLRIGVSVNIRHRETVYNRRGLAGEDDKRISQFDLIGQRKLDGVVDIAECLTSLGNAGRRVVQPGIHSCPGAKGVLSISIRWPRKGLRERDYRQRFLEEYSCTRGRQLDITISGASGEALTAVKSL